MLKYTPIIDKLFLKKAKPGPTPNPFLSKKLCVDSIKRAATRRQTRASSIRKELPLNQIVSGPRLISKLRDYFIAFDDLKENSIDSVTTSWKLPHTNIQNKMKCWISFLSTPTDDTPGTTLLLHFDAKRYIIGNVAEGTQRAIMQRGFGVNKVSDIFLTGPVNWSTTGGILGMILTLADSLAGAQEAAKLSREKRGTEVKEQKQWLNIHGGENLTHTLATARRFVFRKGLPIHTQEFRAGKDTPKEDFEPTWKDDYIQVWSMVLEPEGSDTTPRKRSHDDFTSDTAPATSPTKGISTDEADQNDQLRRGVVSSMFDSNWRLDTLVTRKLSEVVMPTQIFVRNDEGKIEKYQGQLIGEAEDVPDIEVLVRNPWPGALIETLPPTTPVRNSVSYIIKNHPQRGKFNPKAAIKLGVKAGPDFRKLTLGESVTTAAGNVVTPDQVLAPGKEGGGFAVIDLPNRSYVKAVFERKEWSSKKIMDGIEAVIWILGAGVVDDPMLQSFMKDHAELKHVVSSTDTCSNYIALESPATAAIRLRLLDPDRFPIPTYNNTVPDQKTKGSSPIPYERARVGKTVLLEPKVEIQDDQIVQYLDTGKVVREASKSVQKLADEARKVITSSEYLARLAEQQKDIPSKDAEVITLGTGSAAPSKYRNVSATLLRVPGFGNYLFDCGENTLGQLKRVLGKDLPEVLQDLKAIWISHLHADHHLGTTSVIKAWNEVTKNESMKDKKLIVASDDGMIDWLKEYSDVEDFGHDRLETITMSGHYGALYKKFEQEQTRVHGLTSIQACRVEHCKGALAVVFNFPNGFKVAYSGDCRPSREFAKIGEGATLLIHEATFDDELQGDAYAKKHSTTSEALGVGRQMGARRILLTHFSQRYQKIPVMEGTEGKDQVAIVAFDYMRVKIGDFAKMEAFRPALMKLYEFLEDE